VDLFGRVEIPSERTLVVLLSGGRDSVCLLDIAVRQTRGCAGVVALHINHGLRPAADADEAHCADLCERLGVELIVHRAPIAPSTGNLQAWARDVRYAAAARLADERDADIAAGHTATDQVETVLYRLAASPGRTALLGMCERDGRLIRPLLGSSREQTAAHCAARGLPFVEDASNADPRFARNRVRHELVAQLKTIHPAAEANVLRTLDLLRDEAAVLDALVDEVTPDPPTTAALRALPPALRRLVLRRLAGRPVPDHVADLEHGALDLGRGLRAVVEHGVLRFDRAGPPAAPADAVLALPGRVAFGAGELRAELGSGLAIGDGTLDAVTLGPDALTVRSWREGDRMRPLGLGGASQSLQDLFTNRKVPRERRSQLPVVLVGKEIAWIPGVATAEAFKVTGATRQRARLTWRSTSSRRLSAAPRHRILPMRDPAIGEMLVQADDLQHRVRALGKEISRDYADRVPLLVGVLKGAIFFLSDLMRAIDVPCEVDFMAVASYGSATDSSGVVRILKDLDMPIEGRDVLIVEDIVDSGLTLQYLLRSLQARGPASLEVCALLTKPERRKVELSPRYVGFEIPNRFAIGYGLDHAERYRNLPYVAALRT